MKSAAAIRLIVVAACMPIGGCREQSRFANVRDQLPSPAPPVAQGTLAGPPAIGCATTVLSERRLVEMGSIAPIGVRKRAHPQDSTWHVLRLLEGVRFRDRFVVADDSVNSLWQLSTDFRYAAPFLSTHTLSGYAEITALTVDPSNDTLWVALRQPSALIGITRNGYVARTVPISRAVASLARRLDGRFVVANAYLPKRMSPDSASVDPVVLVSADGKETAPLFSVNESDMERIALPGPNPIVVRPAAGPDGVIVAYPATGVVDVYRGMKRVTTRTTCRPSAIDDYYRHQREAARETTRSQRWYPLLTDVQELPNGTLRTVSRLPDQSGVLHVEQFGASGGASGSVHLGARGRRFPGEPRFLGQGDSLLVVSPSGIVLVASYAVPSMLRP